MTKGKRGDGFGISYYGGKGTIAHKYPEPKYDTIVEPFAGFAKYSFLYWERNVILVEKYEVVARIWKWLQKCSASDILNLPKMKAGETTDSFNFDTEEAKWLMGFLVQQGVSTPRKTVSSVFAGGKMEEAIENSKRNIARSLPKIKHWKIIYGSYEDVDNQCATWFIDPPYQNGGQHYHHSSRNSHIDYSFLERWSKERLGQVIICENDTNTWLKDSVYLTELNGQTRRTKEVIWYREE